MAVGRAAAAARADAARHPGDRARGVPHGPRRLEGRDLPDSAGVGRVLRPGSRGGDGPAHRRLDARSSASIRGSRLCSTSSATRAGAASTSASPRTRTSSARSAPPTCEGCRMPASTPRSSTSSGYSASQAGRNHAPVQLGRRELADVLLPPFEMAMRDGGARSVMNSYAEIDGVPGGDLGGAADRHPARAAGASTASSSPTTSRWRSCTRCTPSPRTSARRPRSRSRPASTSSCRRATRSRRRCAAAVRDGRVDEALVDRAVLRVLAEKEELGLLDETFDQPPTEIDLDTPAHRERRASPRRGVGRPALERRDAAARARRARAASP